jgi:hypothetical protein
MLRNTTKPHPKCTGSSASSRVRHFLLACPFPLTYLFLPALIIPDRVHAGAWAVAPGAGKAVISTSYLKARKVIDSDGKKHAFDVEERALSTFGEIGLAPDFSAGWSWTPAKAAVLDSFDKMSPGDPEFSLSWHVKSMGKLQIAAQALAVFPLGSRNPTESPDYLYGVFSHRAFAFEVRPVLGWSGGGVWLQAGAGPRARTNALSPQFHYNLAFGGGLGPRLAWLLALSGIVPLDTETNGKPGDQEKYFGYQVAGEYLFTPAWQAGAQFDSMFTVGQEMPLGARVNVFVRFAWLALWRGRPG